MNTPADRKAWFEGGDALCERLATIPPRAYHLILLGPPGVGKGTQAEMIGERLGTCHLSTGDLFRSARTAENASPALRKALDAMSRGELVPDELVVDMVRERLHCLNCRCGFLLDGFPRTVAQAEALQEILDQAGVNLDSVICFKLPIDQIVDRLGGRRTCKECKAVYHVTAVPPKVAGVCDACQGPLVQREDDRPESIRVRMEAYEESTRPLIEFYREAGKLVLVPADGSPAEVFERAMAALKEHAPY